MANPLEELDYPVCCCYPGCGETLHTAIQVSEHIGTEHLPESIWTFAEDNMCPVSLSTTSEERK